MFATEVWIYTGRHLLYRRCLCKYVETADSWRAGSFLLHLPTVCLFLSRSFAQTMQLRLSLYLPVAATTSNRVRQMDRRNDTVSMVGVTLPATPSFRSQKSIGFSMLNRKCDHCLRSPHWMHTVSAHWGPHKTSTALCILCEPQKPKVKKPQKSKVKIHKKQK